MSLAGTQPWAVLLALSVLLGPAHAEPTPLPEPLSLAHALSLADELHPDLALDQAELERRRAAGQLVSAGTDLDISLQGLVGWVEPPDVSLSDTNNNSQASLVVKKRLYDFGRTDAAVRAGAASVDGQKARLFAQRQQRRLDILESYLEVSLTDLRFMRDNEAMAIAFVRYDDARDSHELGRLSEVELLRLQTRFLEARTTRSAAEARQRSARSKLAMVLNRPGELSSDLEKPVLKGNRRALPELQVLEQQLLENNPLLRALQQEVRAAELRVREADADGGPVIDGRVAASTYNRQTGTTYPWRADLQFTVPLYTGDRVRARTAQRRAELVAKASELAGMELQLRQQLLELWLRLGNLYQQQEEVQVNQESSEIALEHSRALYELEKGANFGNAMVTTSEARVRLAENEYQTALAWARLDALTGAEPEQISANLLRGTTP